VEALEEAYLVLGGVGVEVVEVTAEEFYDYLTGETFTRARGTFRLSPLNLHLSTDESQSKED